MPEGTADASGSLVKISGVLGTALPVIGQTKTHAATPSPLTSSANGGGPAGSVSTLTYSLLTSTSASTVGTSASVARADVKAASVTFSLPGTIPSLPTLSVAATAIDSHAVATATQTAASTTGSSAGLGSLVINGNTVPTTPGTTTLAGFITVVLGEVVTTAGPVPANQEATVTATACRITVALPGVPKFEIVLGSTTAKADLATSC